MIESWTIIKGCIKITLCYILKRFAQFCIRINNGIFSLINSTYYEHATHI